MRTLLIDGDIDAYQIAARNEQKIDWGTGTTSVVTNADEAKRQIEIRYKKYKKMLGADDLIVAISDDENFRKSIYPNYKANRKAVIRPALLAEMKKFLADTFRSFKRPTLEADDVLGILATMGDEPGLITGERIVVSEDKDLKCIPGLLFNPRHPERGTVEISEETADLNHLRQTLTGDPTDNYPGCPGIGLKKAELVLTKKHADQNLWDLVVAAFVKKELTEKDAIVQAQVARICRASDYDFISKRPVPWTPHKNNKEAA